MSLRSFFNYLLSFLLAVIFLYIAFHDVNFGEVLEIVSNANLLWMTIFILLFYLGHILRAYRWKFILHSVKANTKFSHLFGSLMIGYGVNCITPKLGELTRAVLFGRWEGLSRSSMFGTVILERIIDIIALAVSVLIAIFISTENIRDSFPWLLTTLYVSAVLIFIFILFLYFILRYEEKFSNWIINLLNRFSHSIADKVAYIFSMLTQGFFSLKGRKNYYITFLLSALIIVVYALTSYVGLLMINMQYIQPVTFTMGWVLMSISSIGVIIPTPGSTGSYHTLAKSTLVLLYGFGETVSAAYAFLTHIISYILFILTSVVIYFIFYKKQGSLEEISKTHLEEL
ncbi:lysylphosphatidylglycerol synthase transmembrane domain-containing protein [Ignavibacterium album]|uniref:lysylphosphatidylglycerol synthase transmembrane domain-containing protein n=1 Tax=Ignavibacterium album TaxID=591197 RepID=UPI001438A2BA|nr:lysylphosphatidylglycerol synthase transmembrane domain-containing protein [Ignavibacterium album]